MERPVFYEKTRTAVVEGDKEGAGALAREAVSEGADLLDVIENGFLKGIQTVGDLWEKGEYFLPELVMSADALKAAMDVLQPKLAETNLRMVSAGKVVIGTVEGDIHDIGKNLVSTMLQANGFEVDDLGADVKVERFLERAEAGGADLICLSALLTTTMTNQKRVIDLLKAQNLRGKYRVLVGGAPASQKWASDIGADGYAENAVLAVKAAKGLMAAWRKETK